YVLLIPFFNKLIRNASASSAYAHKEKNNLELDLVRHSKAINQHGLKNSWLQRYHKLNKVTVKSARNQLRLSLLMQNTSFVIGQFTSLATMATGIYLVMLQKLSAGDLIAAMMLARRVTSPIQASAMSFNKLGRFKNTLTQIDRYIPLEDEQSPAENIFNSNAGVSFENVVFRYGNNQDPALSAVSFETEANKTIAIAGPNNSGKTTLINILSKCLDAQSGKVLIGKSKLKNISSNHFRTEIAYAGEWLPKAQISIIKYLQELLPLCSESHIRESCGKHNLVSLLKEKNLDLDSALLDIHDSFLKKYIAVIHLLIKDAPIILIDVNFNAQYQKEKDLFVYLLDHFHGKKTVFYTTLCADLMQLADSALILDKGAVAHFGPIEKKAEASS
ncbi:MAG: ABC transporter ATP-binding protein/permease, partial [Lentisphaeraceae bacterium]|nr:ABC transporter ATP-binding protein/permease [Lentisphaeraceae bacterium]